MTCKPCHQAYSVGRSGDQRVILISTMKLFAAVLSVLIVTGRCQRSRDSICQRENGIYAHEEYCDYYYKCIDGEAILQACPNGLAFSGRGRGLINNCDYPHRANCPDNDGRVMGQTPSGSGNCPWQFGIFPHQTSCTRYWQCWNNTSTVQHCPFSLLYNEAVHACDWPDNVPGCQQHPICKGNTNGLIAISSSCFRYWQCVGGYPRLQRCAAGLAFNSEALRCDWAANVDGCEPATSGPTSRPQDARRPQSSRADEADDSSK